MSNNTYCGLCGQYVKAKENYQNIVIPNAKNLTEIQRAYEKIKQLDYYILLCKTCSYECQQGVSKSYACARKQGTNVSKASFYEKVAMVERSREEEKLKKLAAKASENIAAARLQKQLQQLPNAPQGF